MDFYLLISVFLMILGLIGVFTAILPGTILVLAGIVLYGWGTGFTVISLKTLVLFGLLTLTGIIFDYAASFISAKKFKLSKAGFWGMILGGLIGFFVLSLVGLIVGQFLGILFGELFAGKGLWASLKAGGASIVGYLLSTMVNFLIAIVMVGYFTIKVLWK